MMVGAATFKVEFKPGTARDFINRKLEAGMINVGKKLEKAIASSLKPGHGVPSSPGTPPNSQTGKLKASLQSVYTHSGEYHTIVVSAGGEGVPYAKIQERGGTIYAKNAGALTIPVNAQAKAASRAGMPARSINGLFLVNRPGGKGLLAKKSPGHNGGLDVWYVLRKSVTLPARPFMLPGLFRSKSQIPGWIADGARRANVQVAA